MRNPSQTMPRKALNVAGGSLLISFAAGLFFFVQPNFASAADSTCHSHGVVTDAVGGAGVNVTVTTTGNCTDAPLTLSSVDAAGIATVLNTVPRETTDTGTTATMRFVPAANVTYDVSIDGAFNATITK